jgi:hypothetical protein
VNAAKRRETHRHEPFPPSESSTTYIRTLLSRAACGEALNESNPAGDKPTWGAGFLPPSLYLQPDSDCGPAGPPAWPAPFNEGALSHTSYGSEIDRNLQYGQPECPPDYFDDFLWQVYG